MRKCRIDMAARFGSNTAMQRSPHTVPINVFLCLLDGVRKRHGITDAGVAKLLEEAGISPELLHTSGARITASQYADALGLLIEKFSDECLGFLSLPFKRGSFMLVGRSAIGAPTLQVALRRAVHTFTLLQHDVTLEVVQESDLCGFAMSFDWEDIGAQNFLHEMLVRVFWQMLAWLNAGRLPLRRVDFSFPEPAYSSVYPMVFSAPLRFNQPRTVAWFDIVSLQAPVRRDEEALRASMVSAPARIVMPRPRDYATSNRVRVLLLRSEPEWPDLDAIALKMHMSGSTLQRRLAVEGVSFQSLKDQLRRDLAIERLTTGSAPVSQLAIQLGFADATAFNRAFKVWTGSTPGSYRRR
jgi:AraC-like DNA-binding protein